MDIPILTIKDLVSGYGKKIIVNSIKIRIEHKQITTLIGRNGVGKTTMLKTLMGLIPPVSGSIEYMGSDITNWETDRIVRNGISYVPQGKSVFPHMSVFEHFDIGSYTVCDARKVVQKKEQILNLFPRLRERAKQKAGTLSGGERQMLSIGRALMSVPKLLILDEPSFGLAPNIVDDVFKSIIKVNEEGVDIFVVEQNAKKALSCSKYGYVMDMGKIVFEGESDKLLNDKEIRNAYLGGSSQVIF